MIHDKKWHANKSVVPDTAKYPTFTEQNSENSSPRKVFLYLIGFVRQALFKVCGVAFLWQNLSFIYLYDFPI